MKIPLRLGTLSVTGDVFTSITGYAATNCFGVKGMASRNLQSGIVQLLRRDSLAKGVRVTYPENGDSLDIELHIVIEHGVNIPALCRSIVSEVRYHVEKMTGVRVGHVAVCIDSIVIAEGNTKERPKPKPDKAQRTAEPPAPAANPS